MNEKQEDIVNEAIKNISKKKHIVSEEAKKAKEEYDLMKETLEGHYNESSALTKRLAVLDEFNDSVKILSNIFEISRFDELAFAISNPTRMLILNLFIGIMRGIGFIIGIILVAFLVAYLIKTSLSPQLIEKFLMAI